MPWWDFWGHEHSNSDPAPASDGPMAIGWDPDGFEPQAEPVLVKPKKPKAVPLVWTDQTGHSWPIPEMATSHLRNAIAYIERNANRLKRIEVDNAYRFSMHVQGEMAMDIIDREIDMLEEMLPQEYLDQFEPYRQMKKELKKREKKQAKAIKDGTIKLDEVPK